MFQGTRSLDFRSLGVDASAGLTKQLNGSLDSTADADCANEYRDAPQSHGLRHSRAFAFHRDGSIASCLVHFVEHIESEGMPDELLRKYGLLHDIP